MNFQRYGNPSASRPASGPNRQAVSTSSQRCPPGEVEYLWFAGDYACCGQRPQRSRGPSPRCCSPRRGERGMLMEKGRNPGNDVRRSARRASLHAPREELRGLSGAKVRKLLTTDPHSYNTLKNERCSRSRQRAPTTRTTVLQSAGPARRPAPARGTGTEKTDDVHRHLPRSVLPGPVQRGVRPTTPASCNILGARLVEMPRHGPNSFCCGAGGGRIWMKDTPGVRGRPAESRVKEALALPPGSSASSLLARRTWSCSRTGCGRR